jgi:putative ABC transport system substrate-binding protein
MNRRQTIWLLAGAAAWLLAARAQQSNESDGVLMGLTETDPFTIGYVRELRDGLRQLGWTDGQNIQFTYRYAAGDPRRARTFATDATVSLQVWRGQAVT